ncbi:MAG: AAA family ATPase, partial [Mariprofundaceae bacterium]
KDETKDIKDKDTILDALQFKRQIELQGPPGTGKSYTAKRMAQALTGKLENELDSENAEWQMVQFHPSYNYEDFVRGIQVNPEPAAKTECKGAVEDENKAVQSGQVQYKTVNRIFAEMCETAKMNPTKAYVLIIDEMNRANLPAVLGELIYGLEYRGEEVQTPYAVNNKTGLVVPENLFVIGTMNTADRSIGHIDYAIRRRFAFIDVLPDPNVVPEDAKEHFVSVQKLFLKDYKVNEDGKEENFENAATLSPEYEANHVRIGHSYFMASSKELDLKMQYEVLPILREYLQDGILDDSVDGLKDALASWDAFKKFPPKDEKAENKNSE